MVGAESRVDGLARWSLLLVAPVLLVGAQMHVAMVAVSLLGHPGSHCACGDVGGEKGESLVGEVGVGLCCDRAMIVRSLLSFRGLTCLAVGGP